MRVLRRHGLVENAVALKKAMQGKLSPRMQGSLVIREPAIAPNLPDSRFSTSLPHRECRCLAGGKAGRMEAPIIFLRVVGKSPARNRICRSIRIRISRIKRLPLSAWPLGNMIFETMSKIPGAPGHIRRLTSEMREPDPIIVPTNVRMNPAGTARMRRRIGPTGPSDARMRKECRFSSKMMSFFVENLTLASVDLPARFMQNGFQEMSASGNSRPHSANGPIRARGFP